jgi:hypothetical protein
MVRVGDKDNVFRFNSKNYTIDDNRKMNTSQKIQKEALLSFVRLLYTQ